jgi:hypothetical protein
LHKLNILRKWLPFTYMTRVTPTRSRRRWVTYYASRELSVPSLATEPSRNSSIRSPCFALQSAELVWEGPPPAPAAAACDCEAVLCWMTCLSLSTVLESVARTAESFEGLPDVVLEVVGSTVGLRGGAAARPDAAPPPPENSPPPASESSDAALSDRNCIPPPAPTVDASRASGTGLRARDVKDDSPSDERGA